MDISKGLGGLQSTFALPALTDLVTLALTGQTQSREKAGKLSPPERFMQQGTDDSGLESIQVSSNPDHDSRRS